MDKNKFIHIEYKFKKWLFGIIQTRTFYETFHEKLTISKSIKLFGTIKHYSIKNDKKILMSKGKYRNGKLSREENIVDEYTTVYHYNGKYPFIIECWYKGDLIWKKTIKTEYK